MIEANKIYSVKEIFLTLQGEGYNTGTTAVFCRFSGCNLWNGIEKDRKKAVCSFCDTDFNGVDGINGGKYKLDNLVILVDYNKIQALNKLKDALPLGNLLSKFKSFNCNCIEIKKGHSFNDLIKGFVVLQKCFHFEMLGNRML